MANTVQMTKVYQDGSQITPGKVIDEPVGSFEFGEMTITVNAGANISANSMTGLSFAKTQFHVGDRVVSAGIINAGVTVASIPDDFTVILSSSGVAANAFGAIAFTSTYVNILGPGGSKPKNIVVSETRAAILALCNAPLA